LGTRIVVRHDIEYLRRGQRHDTPPLIAPTPARDHCRSGWIVKPNRPLQRIEWVNVTNIFAATTRHRSWTTCKFLHIPVA
jgi:hypothetical protein